MYCSARLHCEVSNTCPYALLWPLLISSAFKFDEYAPGRTFAESDEEWGAGKPGFGELTLHG